MMPAGGASEVQRDGWGPAPSLDGADACERRESSHAAGGSDLAHAFSESGGRHPSPHCDRSVEYDENTVLTWRDAAAQLDPAMRCGLAFSGGCDSSFLLAALMRAGIDVKAYMVMTAFQAPFELDDALRVVEETGAPFELIRADVLARDEICANPPDRCYHCKRFIFGAVSAAMERDGRTVLLDGTNASDDPARRPGFRALAELGVVSPLRAAGFTKDLVRAASREMGLSTADKPNFSCLATKVPAGSPITQEALDEAARLPECREAARLAGSRA